MILGALTAGGNANACQCYCVWGVRCGRTHADLELLSGRSNDVDLLRRGRGIHGLDA